MPSNHSFALGFAALAGLVFVASSCGPTAPADSTEYVKAFAEHCDAGDLDGALARLAACPKDHETSLAIIRAADIGGGLGLYGEYDAARAKTTLGFIARLLKANVLTPAAADALRVRAFAANLKLDDTAAAFASLAGCERAEHASADIVAEADAYLKRGEADKSPTAQKTRITFIDSLIRTGVLADASADALRARIFTIHMDLKDLDAALAVLTSCGKTPEVSRAARRATSAALRAAAPEDVVPLLEKLLACTWFRPADHVAQLTEDQVIRFAGDGASKAADVVRLKELLAFSKKLLDMKVLGEDAAAALKERRLDGFFLSNDYDGAIACLENEGVPKRSPAWCKGTAAKLRAHKAMEAKDNKEAIKQLLVFGAFMLSDEQKDFEDCDPTTGIVYSREWVVARNYMRCSKMSRELNDTAAADKYLADAKKNFAIALAKAKDDAKSLETLKAELKKDNLDVQPQPLDKKPAAESAKPAAESAKPAEKAPDAK